jgi:hypothetical protein
MQYQEDIISLLNSYLNVNSPNSWDKDKILHDLQKYECRDLNKEFFLTITDITRKYVPIGVFTFYSSEIEDLVQFGDLLIQKFQLNNFSITIFKTTTFGGSAVYNDSAIGMVLSKNVTH